VKLWKSIEVQADNLGRTQYIDVYYRIDKGEWTEAGSVKTSPATSIGLEPAGVAGEAIEIRLDLVQAGDVTPIIVRTVIARAIERPDTTDIISAVVRCADNLPLRTAGRCPRTGEAILQELKALGEYATAVELVDTVGSTRRVVVIPPVVEQAEYDQSGEMSRELLINLQMAVVEFEESRFTEVTIYDGGSGHALLIPLTVPITLGGESMDGHFKDFTSTKVSRPRITIVGSANNLVITDNEGRKLDFTGYALTTANIITIDMHVADPTVIDETGDAVTWKAILADNGSNLNSFAVVEGPNRITVAGSGAVAATRIYLEY
jgi:hypothetical protein